MAQRTYRFKLGASLREAVQNTLEETLRAAIPDRGLRRGLLEGLVQALNTRAQGSVPRWVPVTVSTTEECVEVQIRDGSVHDTLVYTLPGAPSRR